MGKRLVTRLTVDPFTYYRDWGSKHQWAVWHLDGVSLGLVWKAGSRWQAILIKESFGTRQDAAFALLRTYQEKQ